ncbi:sodium:proton antiporter [Sediminicola sp. YIK13]|uniref:cation:proton antiporter n=1 Tax=Sediminicola sp. YIK13 TaxID=1453352 RepID=UPI00072272FF|nr:cation:proton antiporter [Sediminicola sp. YIK13]ALM08509.1 sodium:proton antiporter [Sediminicola sp. YIK13]
MDEIVEQVLHHFKLPLEKPVLIFSLILFVILMVPILMNKLRIPGIIGLIISGAIIGPNGFNLLEKSLFVDLFSTIGLLYIMFIAGLDLDLNDFKTNRNKSIWFGLFTFSIPLGIGFPVCYYFLEYDFDASLLTASMFATHTLVTYPIVSKLGITKNQEVAITVGGTILTDTAVLIILAVLVGSHEGNLTYVFWLKLLISLSIFMVIMFGVVPRVSKWFFKKLESEKHSHYIFVLAIVFFAAFLAELAGVEPIIGAFVAGLALNRLIPHSSVLMNRIEFIGNALFIPFFLISVGMLVDFSVILSGPTALIVAATLTIVAIFGKWLAAFFTQVIFKYSKLQRRLIFGLSSSHAAATLAVILVGYKAKILDENILNGTVILILATCIVASFVTERAAKNLVIAMEDETYSPNKNQEINEHIVLPIANNINLEKALDFALLIKDKKSSYPLSILSVVPNNREAERNITRARQKLKQLIDHATASETRAEVIAVIDFNIFSGIARTAREILANIIILGWPQRTGIIDQFFGKKLEVLLSNTDKTVFVCHFEQPLSNHKRIVVVLPPLAELEQGFDNWMGKLTKLASELGISILYFCNPETENAIGRYTKRSKITQKNKFQILEIWESILDGKHSIERDDLLLFVSSRRSGISYLSMMENLPSKLEEKYSRNSKIIIYP